MSEERRTERLLVRRPEPSDLDGYEAVLLDPDVETRLRGAERPRLDEEWVSWRLGADEVHWDEHGFGPWAVFELDGGRLVGRAGLQEVALEDRSVIEVAWAIAPQHWNRGFATEVGEAALELARERELPEVVALITPDNDPSRRVAEKLGLHEEGQTMKAGLPHVIHRSMLA